MAERASTSPRTSVKLKRKGQAHGDVLNDTADSSPRVLVLTLAGAIFTGELLVMLLLMLFPVASPLLEALLDATILLTFVSPALYWFVYRPLKQRIRLLQFSTNNIRGLSSALLRTREDEQRRLALDLHDELGQSLSALQFEMESMKGRLGPAEGGLAPHCTRMIRQVQQLGAQVRSISQTLRPTILDDLGVVPALEWLTSQLHKQRPDLTIDFTASGVLRRPRADVETALFRICQEALTNICRHAQASSVQVRLLASYPDLILTIRDNGCGFDPGEDERRTGEHLGLLGMRERARSVGGKLTIESREGAGTLVRVQVSLEPQLFTEAAHGAD